MEETKLDINTENVQRNKKIVPIILSIIGAIVLFAIVFFTVDCVMSGESSVNSNGLNTKLEVTNLSLTVDYSEYLGYSAVVTGTAKNVSGKNLSYASVEFSIYDSYGNNLGTALANINNLATNDTWQFEAHLFSYPSTEPVRCKLVKIYAW